MNKPKRTRNPVTGFRLRRRVMAQLQALAEEHETSRTEMITRLIKESKTIKDLEAKIEDLVKAIKNKPCFREDDN